MPRKTIPTNPPAERAFLVGVEFRSEKPLIPLEDSLNELALLAQTVNLEVVGEATQNWKHLIRAPSLAKVRWKRSQCWRRKALPISSS